jgi:hypothetical protein
VTAFHQIPDGARGKSFAMVPDEDQGHSLEWRQYSDRVARNLVAKGLREAPPKEADLAVFIRYGIDGGVTNTSTIPILARLAVGQVQRPGGSGTG